MEEDVTVPKGSHESHIVMYSSTIRYLSVHTIFNIFFFKVKRFINHSMNKMFHEKLNKLGVLLLKSYRQQPKGKHSKPKARFSTLEVFYTYTLEDKILSYQLYIKAIYIYIHNPFILIAQHCSKINNTAP